MSNGLSPDELRLQLELRIELHLEQPGIVRTELRHELLVVRAVVPDGLSPDELRLQLELRVELHLEQPGELLGEHDAVHAVRSLLPVGLLRDLDRLQPELRIELHFEQPGHLQESLTREASGRAAGLPCDVRIDGGVGNWERVPSKTVEATRVWQKLIRKLGTPIPMALFFVTAVSGLMMFFHVGDRFVKGLHEWLSVAFVVGSVLHVARNWKAFVGYFRTRGFWFAASITALAGIALVAPAVLGAGGERGRGGSALERVALEAKLSELAPVLHTTPEALAERLRKQGLSVSGDGATLGEVAKSSGREPREVLDLAVGGPGGAGGPGGRGRGPRG